MSNVTKVKSLFLIAAIIVMSYAAAFGARSVSGRAADGNAIYAARCSVCHGRMAGELQTGARKASRTSRTRNGKSRERTPKSPASRRREKESTCPRSRASSPMRKSLPSWLVFVNSERGESRVSSFGFARRLTLCSRIVRLASEYQLRIRKFHSSRTEFGGASMSTSAPQTDRKFIDCRNFPSDKNCSLRISGTEDEILEIAVQHAVASHGHENTRELREELRSLLQNE